jgi:hypothetical protein
MLHSFLFLLSWMLVVPELCFHVCVYMWNCMPVVCMLSAFFCFRGCLYGARIVCTRVCVCVCVQLHACTLYVTRAASQHVAIKSITSACRLCTKYYMSAPQLFSAVECNRAGLQQWLLLIQGRRADSRHTHTPFLWLAVCVCHCMCAVLSERMGTKKSLQAPVSSQSKHALVEAYLPVLPRPRMWLFSRYFIFVYKDSTLVVKPKTTSACFNDRRLAF